MDLEKPLPLQQVATVYYKPPAGFSISTNFRQLLYAHYECFALSVSVHYVLGGCAMRRIASYSFDCITLVNFKFILLTFWLFFFQIVK